MSDSALSSFGATVLNANDASIETARRGRQSATISSDWYDLFNLVIERKGDFVTLPTTHERVKSTANVRSIIKRIAEEKGYKMAERDRTQKGDVIQVVSRVVKMNTRGQDVYVSPKPNEEETHAFIRFFSK